MINLKEYVDFLIDYELTPKQFIVLMLLYKKEKNLLIKLKKSLKIEKTFLSKEELSFLLDKKLLIKTKTGFSIGNTFKDIFITPIRAADEVYEIYPSFINNGGVNIPLTSMDKNVFGNIYINKINGSLQEHNEVLKDIKFGIDNELIRIGISKFLTSEQWKSIRKLRLPTTSSKLSQHIPTDENF